MDSPILTPAQMRAAEKAAFARGTTAERLMEQAGAGIARCVQKFFPQPGRCLVFTGKGNNGGDALVAARHLSGANWAIELQLPHPEKELGELPARKLRELRAVETRRPPGAAEGPLIVLDGLLGLGAKPPLREPLRKSCREINRLRLNENAFVFAIDLPTGLDGENGRADRDAVVADFTVTIGFAKKGLLADDALDFIGRLEVVELTALRKNLPKHSLGNVATPGSLRALAPRRPFGTYKNQCGRVGIVAGSKGFTGAAVLCALGALRAGAGLVEVFVPEDVYEIVAAAAPIEAMVKPVAAYTSLGDEEVDAWGIGPGLGRAHGPEILEFVRQTTAPMVVDADALNLLAEKPRALARCAGPRLATPHPGEMKRLFPNSKGTRAQIAQSFGRKFPVALLFKGSRTIVAEKGKALSYNTTGNPGMATGGMGDVLTGVCTALMARHLSGYDAARLGAWVCGRAAELAIFSGRISEESLLPQDVLEFMGSAFDDLRIR